jgi:hypothetical protein
LRSSGVVLVDDHLLLELIFDRPPEGLGLAGQSVSTTGLWYHRLCRAVANQTVTGAMSKSLGNIDHKLAAVAVSSIVELPGSISMASLRSLGWPMATLLGSGVRLNLMSLEALAAAVQLGADICLAEADTNPPLCEAAERLGVSVRIFPL